MCKNLAVFDFDYTIIDDNSDTAIMKLIGQDKIPEDVKQLYRSDGWTAYMQGIFDVLQKNNVNEKAIAHIIKEIPPITGMCDLITELNDRLNFDVVIVSDSNSYFINAWLEKRELTNKILKVFTNPAEFENGLLKIQMYHFQDHCNLSTKNLCKGQVMEDFIKEQKSNGINYAKVVYIGDGSNDFCPILRLKENDLACVRDKYKCSELVKKAQNLECNDKHGNNLVVNSNVFVWNNGFEILKLIEEEYCT